MFSEDFANQSLSLEKALAKKLGKRGVKLPEKKKDLNLFQEFYTFLKDHLPPELSLATGKVRNKKHLLNRDCDVLIYRKWCAKFLDLTGGYVLADALNAFITIEAGLTASNLATHASLSRALKVLHSGEREVSELEVVPMYSLLFAYESEHSLLFHKQNLIEISQEKEIPVNMETDLICVLGQGLIIKDWEIAGGYKVVETGPDTMMWFYILLMEYLDRDGALNLNLRDYIKNNKEYNEY